MCVINGACTGEPCASPPFTYDRTVFETLHPLTLVPSLQYNYPPSAWIGGDPQYVDLTQLSPGQCTLDVRWQANCNQPLREETLYLGPCRPPCNDCDDGQCFCQGGASPGGGGGRTTGERLGPGVTLRYLAGGVGAPGFPGSAQWNVALGRFWAHEGAERLAEENPGDPSHMWLLKRDAGFVEFTDTSPGDPEGLFEAAAPGDEYRKLFKTAAGFELRSLDGTVQSFDNTGLWLATTDRNGNEKVATYNPPGVLESIDFADRRRELFTYHPGGRLARIDLVGVNGTATRTWTYEWSDADTGLDLVRVNRPDATAYEFLYADPNHPGYMTRMTLVGSQGGERIVQGWEYDAYANVTKTWRGAPTATDPLAVERWEYDFVSPTETAVTDPLGNVATYTLDRDPASRQKMRVLGISGDCPTCDLGANTQLLYDDPRNPMRATRQIDARGHTTLLTYDTNGQRTSRVEAMGTSFERQTTWVYGDPAFPALVTEIARPSTTGDPFDERRTVFGFDPRGNQLTRTDEGVESGAPFSFVTATTYAAEGRPELVDPPGFGTSDQTSYTYDPARGGLMMDSRTDPLTGTTLFTYDAFNRDASVTDPDGVVTETTYDALDRVRFVIQRGVVPAEDLVTENVYNTFGDLFQTILPRGNVLEYGYDHAGRLTSSERKPDADPLSHGERTLWQLNGFGHRIRESQQRWDGVAWVSEAETEFQYSNRCQLGKTITGAGSPAESVTEFAYDCNGNLERSWDANHPSAGQTAPASTVYGYDDLDRMTTVTRPWGGAGGGDVVTTYGYDVQNHLSRVTDAEGSVTTYAYSDRDLLTRETSEVSGTSTFTYNDHGQLTTETDARGVVATRGVDELDRVTSLDYPDATLDVTYTYDDPAVPFSSGRLTRIARDGVTVDYAYDSFGRLTRDGDLTYAYDKNDNRIEVGHPGDVRAITSYDFADRPATLTVEGLAGALLEPLVTAAGYEPAGPLSSLSLGNGLTETRAFDTRYSPTAITVAGGTTLLDWQYTSDGVGNVGIIADALDAANGRAYGYQDYQYFLTQGDGPWDALAWTYDGIGNRLTESRAPQPADTYSYQPNGAGGNTSQLDQIVLGAGGIRDFTYDASGNQTQVSSSADVVDFGYDDASRLASVTRPASSTELRYEGRSLLRSSTGEGADLTGAGILCDGFESGDTSAWSPGGSGLGTCNERVVTQPVYSSGGVLHFLDRTSNLDAALSDRYVFYFGSRPLASMELAGGSATFQYLSVDHLGTPVLATDEAGALVWEGGFEPFGADYSGAEASGVFLRFPGQWVDSTWTDATSAPSLYHNVYRWYQAETGRYSRIDPISFSKWSHEYYYVDSNPILFFDSRGLHLEGGPWHPEGKFACKGNHECPKLEENIAKFTRTLLSHTLWDIHNASNVHSTEIRDLTNGLNKCLFLFEKEKCDQKQKRKKGCGACREKFEILVPVITFGYTVYRSVQLFRPCPRHRRFIGAH